MYFLVVVDDDQQQNLYLQQKQECLNPFGAFPIIISNIHVNWQQQQQQQHSQKTNKHKSYEKEEVTTTKWLGI